MWHYVLFPTTVVFGVFFIDALIILTFVSHEWQRVVNVPETRTIVCLILIDSSLDVSHKCPWMELFLSTTKKIYKKEKRGLKLNPLSPHLPLDEDSVILAKY